MHAAVVLSLLVLACAGPDAAPGVDEAPPAARGAPLAGCRPSGCSRQVCAEEDVITTCEWRSEYACYRTARCERQPDGACGWTVDEALRRCLDAAR